MEVNENCVRECEKQGPCESCIEFKPTRINVDDLNRKYKRPKYRPSSVNIKPHDSEWYR